MMWVPLRLVGIRRKTWVHFRISTGLLGGAELGVSVISNKRSIESDSKVALSTYDCLDEPSFTQYIRNRGTGKAYVIEKYEDCAVLISTSYV